MPIEKLRELIKPSGYSNQKSNYVLNFIDFFEKLNGKIPSREELLAIKGVGEETADSMLLYGFKQSHFKVDAYTKRLLMHYKIIDEKTGWYSVFILMLYYFFLILISLFYLIKLIFLLKNRKKTN